MPIALSVFGLDEIEEKIFLNETKKTFSLSDFQSNLDSIAEIKDIQPATTTFTRTSYNPQTKRAKYYVEHWTDTNKEIIRAFLKDPDESILYADQLLKPLATHKFEYGFQTLVKLNIMIDFVDKEIFVFMNKRIAKQIINRLEAVGGLKSLPIFLNLKNIS